MRSFLPTKDKSTTMGLSDNADLFQRLSLCELYNRTLEVFQSRFGAFMALSLAFHVPVVFINLWLISINTTINEHPEEVNADPGKYLGRLLSLLLFEIVVFLLVMSVARGAISRTVGDIYIGNDPSLLESLKVAGDSLASLLGATGLLFLGIMCLYLVTAVLVAIFLFLLPEKLAGLGYALTAVTVIAAVAAIFIVTVRMALLVPSIMLEKKGPVEAIKRSWEVSGYGFCFLFCSIFVFQLVNMLVAVVFKVFVAGDLHTSLGYVIVSNIPSLFIFPAIAM